jgi:ribose transport system ATP-binding protein
MRGEYGPSVVLAVAIVLLGILAAIVNPSYLTERTFGGVLQLLAPLTFVALGQLVVLLTGGIDLSVGPLTGFLVVVASFLIVDQPDKIFGLTGPLGLVAGLAAVGIAALVVGLANGWLVRKARIPSVVATLAMFILLQGLMLWFRPQPAGLIQRGFTDLLEMRIWFVPVLMIAAVAVALGLEWALRRTTWGLELRAVGSREDAARRIGIRADRTVIGAYVLCSLIVLLAGLLLMAQIGIGDNQSGPSYTLASITAVVLGGASIYGGRGSFIGALLGAVTIQQVETVTTYLRLSTSAEFLFTGLLTLIAAAVYSSARAARVRT